MAESQDVQPHALIEQRLRARDLAADHVQFCIPTYIDYWSLHTPTAQAILAPYRPPLTYECLSIQLYAIAQCLNSLGIGYNDRVAIVLPNGPEMAVAFLSVAAAAVAVPINPTYQLNEYQRYLRLLDVKALIVQAGQQSPAVAAAQILGIPLLQLSFSAEDAAGIFSLEGAGFPQKMGQRKYPVPDAAALVMQTTGTIDQPKIVPLTHRHICAAASHTASSLQLNSNDRCLNMMPLFHGHGLVAMLLASVTAGASVICTSGFDVQHFFLWLKTFQPTWYSAVPTIHQAILAEAANYSEMIAHSSLRFIRSSSAPLPRRTRDDLERVFDVPVTDSYGLTEALQLTHMPLERSPARKSSVGIATGAEVAIMNAAGDILPPQTPGEIVCRGPNVIHAYEGASPEAFTNGWFRTGDQGYLDQEGYLYLLGRLKELINRGGEKVAPHEVDTVLLEHPAIEQAVTFAIPHKTLGEDIAAAVVLLQGAEATEQAIRDFVSQRLAYFKVPRRILLVTDLPKSATGKLKRTGLADLFGLSSVTSPTIGQQATEQLSQLERLLAKLWREVLLVESVGPNENFFELGGDSIKAAILINRLQEQLGEVIHVVVLFQAPTVKELANYLRIHYSQSVSPLENLLPAVKSDHVHKKITSTQIHNIRQMLSSPNTKRATASRRTEKNPRMVFILAPPRSGTTLLRVMLGGHPMLFAPPELYLLSFETLTERKTAFSQHQRFWSEGLVRAIMQAQQCDVEHAWQHMQEMEHEQFTTQQCYLRLQHWLGDRLLVDKTPSYAFDLRILERAEEYFHQPLYIHLLRHPSAVIQSFEKIRLDQLIASRNGVAFDQAFTRRELAELIWLVCHQNILHFLQRVPAERQKRISFERLVGQPDLAGGELCQFLNIDFHPEILQPYKENNQRMTDGIHQVSKMLGDAKFHTYDAIHPEIANAWRKNFSENGQSLSDTTWHIAQQLGYSPPQDVPEET